ncbi:MAG: CusA/CzcA family heavy metal efflux RND transporter [Brumimicrobium sp.]|nr:CusA/CzcA family heavy metal efflux RND transporter [Brumimicrobium sp.]
MLNRFIDFSIRNKLIIGLFTLALIIYGIFEVTKLPIDAVPDITNNQVQVITLAPDLGATDIERLITFPIEQETSNIKDIKEIRSFSRFGLSVVTIVFEEHTDVYWARQQISERLQTISNEIPEGVGKPEMGPITTGLGEIYQYVVRPKKGYEDKYSLTELRTIQDWIVRRQLLGVKGVAEVSSFGGYLKQFEVAINPNKLQSFDLSVNEIYDALEKNNQNTGGTYIEKGSTVLFIRSEGLISGKEDIENIPVKSTSEGIPILIKDVATVQIGHATQYGALTYNDEGEVAGAIVMMLKGQNSNEVIKKVKERIAQIQESLPEGVVIEPFLDRTKMVNHAIHTIVVNLSEGALIVIFILVLFLGNFRAGFLVASVIPLSMLFAIIMMNIFGVSGNLMSLGALDFGLIVDGAVIIVEAVLHHLHLDRKYQIKDKITQAEMNQQVSTSASQMINSAVFGQIIILIVYIPIFTLQGIEGKMFKPMAQTVTFALIGAFILSLTYIPMMSSLILSKRIKHKDTFSDKIMKKLENIHQRVLKKVINYPKTIITTVIVFFIFALFLFSRLGGEFIPSLDEGDFAIEARVLPGSNLKTSIEYTQKASKILLEKFPEVEKVVTKIGNSEVPTDPMPMEASDMIVILKNKTDWTSAETTQELIQKMSKELETVPGLSIGFMYPVQMRFNELMTGARQDVVCKIFGENIDSLAAYATRLGAIASTVHGAEDIYVEPVTGLPQIVVKYNRSSMAQYNLNIQDVNTIVNTAFAGQPAGFVYEGEKRFELVLRMDEKQRTNVEDIRNLLISTPDGSRIPLYQVADIDVVSGPAQIQREDAKRRIIVGFNVRGRDVQSIVQELQQKVKAEIKLPTGYYTTYGGAFENLNQAKSRLLIAVPISLALIFILLFFAFRSIKESLLIYTAIPLSTIGGVILLTLRGMPFSISAGIGFIALFGVAVLNGIVLISEFNRLKKHGETDLIKIALQGAKTRLRPVLMTAFVASLGFLPMALSNGNGAEVQRPLATVVIGGLLLATFLTLIVLPILFIQFEKINFKKMKTPVPIILVLVSLTVTMHSFGQTITLEQAQKMAEKNNLSIKSSELLAEYYAKQKKAFLSMPQTQITAEIGQINSPSIDNKLGISQAFNFPTFYGQQKKLYAQEWETAVLSSNLNKLETHKLISQLFYHVIVLRYQEENLIKVDTIYAEFLAKSNLKYEKGASNLLEKTSAEIQRENVRNQLNLLESEIELTKIQLQLVLNSQIRYEPLSDSIIAPLGLIDKTSSLENHPSILVSQQEIEMIKTQVKLEKSKLWPELSLGYYNQSFRDLNNQRYNSIEIGVGIPIFTSNQRAQVRGAKQKIALYENEIELKKATLNSELQTQMERLNTQRAIIERYQSLQLPKAQQILELSKLQLDSGEISFMEWVLLNNQAIEIQNNYFEAATQLNQTIIELNYLLAK